MDDSSQVIWKPAKGLETSYEVSSNGDVRNIRAGHSRVLKKKHNSFTGYDFYCLYHEGKQVTKKRRTGWWQKRLSRTRSTCLM